MKKTYFSELTPQHIAPLTEAVRSSGAPITSALALLGACGCNNVSLRCYPPAERFIPAWKEALATVCDVFGKRCRKTSNDMYVMLVALAEEDAWVTCLREGHDPYAFARNAFTILMDAKRNMNEKEPIVSMLRSWVCPAELPPDQASSMSFDPVIARLESIVAGVPHSVVSDLLDRTFGAHWVMFHDMESFNPDCIIRERPAFRPGLLTRTTSLGAREQKLALPELEMS